MSQELNLPENEKEFRITLDFLYEQTKRQIENGDLPRFKGLFEVASSKACIISAIHKIKANKGSKTPGSDNMVIEDILSQDLEEVIELIEHKLIRYKPSEIRRVYIPKPGKNEKRPLGIPTIVDRIIQECVRSTIEPILEAQFFKHSYGFRPMRDGKQAIERAVHLCNRTNNNWVIEGDIKGFFDNVNHSILLKQLWHMGIRDRRILMIIKEMLKAGIMKEIKRNEIGTPQGGIISPLLANVYLHKLDQWIAREWEEKTLRNGTTSSISRFSSLRNYSTISKPAFFIRYADDWILFTSSKENAEKWKYRISKYLRENLKLELSEEKTLITNIKKRPIHFLGFKLKKIPKGKGYVGYTYPDESKLKAKFSEMKYDIRKLKYCTDMEWLVNDINKINSMIRGIINYYNSAAGVNLVMRKFRENLKYTTYKALKKYGGQWIPTNQCKNLKSFYPERMEQVPAIRYKDDWIGIISLGFATWIKYPKKNQHETPYSKVGRELYYKRSKRQPLLVRSEALLNENYLALILAGYKPKKYNFEYFMNRCYAFNRDKGKCTICKLELTGYADTHTHHIDNRLPLHLINKVQNLTTICVNCHKLIHASDIDEKVSHLNQASYKKILKYRLSLSRKEN